MLSITITLSPDEGQLLVQSLSAFILNRINLGAPNLTPERHQEADRAYALRARIEHTLSPGDSGVTSW